MILHTLLLNNQRDSYIRLARVMEKSLNKYSPGIELQIHRGIIDSKIRNMGRGRDQTILHNTLKSVHFTEIIQQCKIGELVGMIDCDTMILNPLDDIVKEDFDLAITHRPDGSKMKFNTGVVFCRVSKKIKKLYENWGIVALEMLEDKSFFDDWKDGYGGINQTSLGYLLENGYADKLNVVKLDCAIWNCENTTWHRFNPQKTKVVHLLGMLRDACLYDKITGYPGMREISAIWNRIERM